MSKKCWILFSLCLLSGIVEFIFNIVNYKNDILSVVICSFGILCFILFLIAMNQFKKGKK